MPRGIRTADEELLKAALEGLEVQRARIDNQIRTVQSMLGQRRGRPSGPVVAKREQPAGGTRQLSEEARRRIAAAQKRRWAAYRKAHKAA
ncbi:MAG: hypothetical protein ACM3ZB_14510 [bacterium]|jgi:hypothetical protein